MFIYKLIPSTKNYIWGGNKLRNKYNQTSEDERIAESWLMSAHDDGMSFLEVNGTVVSLKKFYETFPKLFGSRLNGTKNFPILVKLIDAEMNLSVQVHPDDSYAQTHEFGYGKNEMWIILEAEENSCITFGTTETLDKETFRNHIDKGTLECVLKTVPVKKGNVIFIPAKTIHSIGKGLVIYEIQQSSNLTYRVFDYDRKDSHGHKRDLHIDKAIDVANLNPLDVSVEPVGELQKFNTFTNTLLYNCEYFTATYYSVDGILTIDGNLNSFMLFTSIDGSFTILGDENALEIQKGESFFVSAVEKRVTISGHGSLIMTNM